jgi:CO/xanthine dehydrogenase Mo-binding subunit
MSASGADVAGQTAGNRPLGSSPLRAEDPRLLTGRGRFVGDVVLPRMLEAAFVRSGHANARLGAIDTEAAHSLPGVEAVFTARDLPAVALSFARHPALLPTPQPVLAVDRVRFVGEPLAIVLADNRYVAEDAADQVRADYDVLSARLDAAACDGPPLFDHIDDDVVFRDEQVYGDVEKAFANAATVVTKTLRFPRQLACPLEPRGCVADYDPASKRLTVWSSTQAPHRLARDLAKAVGIPEHRIRVVMLDIGGAFGQKIPTHLEEVGVVLASMATGRPVKWIEDRQENLVAAPHSRDQNLHLELAIDNELRFTGMRARIVGDAGAYSFNSASCLTEAYRSARSIPGVYRVSNYAYDVSIRLSNKSPIAPYRGVGLVAAQCARELLIDEAARRLSVDRFELRSRNMVTASELPYTTCTGWVLKDASFEETFTEARCRLEDPERQCEQPGSTVLRGVGVSPFVEPSGTGSAGGLQVHGFDSPSHDTARVLVDSAGKATVVFGTPSLGQGLETTMAQVAADALGLPMDDVTVSWSDTSHAPVSLTGSRASRAAVVIGGAVGRAATDVRDQLLDVAAKMLEVAVGDLVMRDGKVWVAGEEAPRLSAGEVASAGYLRACLRSPGTEWTFEATRFSDPDASYSNATVAAVVDVDTETGLVHVRRIIGVEDCGTMINPMIVDGQFIGAVAQGIGAALLERFAYNSDGQPITSTLMDYLQPTASDTVRVELSHIHTPSSVTWAGIKGMGESGVIGTVAAIATAVADAVAGAGGAVEELPLLPGAVWTLLQAAGEQAIRSQEEPTLLPG